MTTTTKRRVTGREAMWNLIDRLGPAVFSPLRVAVTGENKAHRALQRLHAKPTVVHPGFVTNWAERRRALAQARPVVRAKEAALARNMRFAAFREVACCPSCRKWFATVAERNACRSEHEVAPPVVLSVPIEAVA